jgi:hypothetical protein
LNNLYIDWVIDFRRRCRLVNFNHQTLLTNYLENKVMALEEEKRLFHLLQFLSFIKSLEIKSFNHWKMLKVKNRAY